MAGRRPFASSVFQFSLRYVLVFVASAAVLLAWLNWNVGRFLEVQRGEIIEAEIQGLAETWRRDGLDGLLAVVRERSGPRGDRESAYLLADAARRPLVGNVAAWPADAPGDGWVEFAAHGADGAPRTVRARTFVLPGGLRLLVGRDGRGIAAIRDSLRDASVLALVAALGIGVASGWWTARSVARRIEAIDHAAREIRDGDLSRRIPLRGSGDEFDRLSDNLNDMLARIQSLMEGVRHVGNSLAHDMRMPLTRVRNRLEQLRGALDDRPEAQAEAAACIAEADQMLATFAALLRIARIEGGAVRRPQAMVDLAALLHDAAELYAALAEDRQVAIDVDAAALRAPGDRDLLFQALANLLDNALKWSPRGARIGLRLAREGTSARIEVADAGPGIDPALRERVFERFFRADDSRGTPGAGLGLALVKAVADLHHATLVLEDARPGLCVVLRLPLAAPAGA